MKYTWFTLPGLCLAAGAMFISGCAQQTAPAGVYTADTQGGAKNCAASEALPPDGKTVLAQMQVTNDGGWCGIISNHGGAPYDSYLLVVRPSHGKVFAHRVGNNTRIDYTPDPGFVGADRFAVSLIPGNAQIESTVTVAR